MSAIERNQQGTQTADDVVFAAEQITSLKTELAGLHERQNRISANFLHMLTVVDLSSIDDETYRLISQTKSELCNGYGLPERAVDATEPQEDPRMKSADYRMTYSVDRTAGSIFGGVQEPVATDFFDDPTLVD